jgi:hypothetical protein
VGDKLCLGYCFGHRTSWVMWWGNRYTVTAWELTQV